jgi:uncharacterized coiled-coil protein SlyX
VAQKEALFGFLSERGHNGEAVVKDVKHPSDADNDGASADIGGFEEVSSQVLVINKKTGAIEAGDVNALVASGNRARANKLKEQKRLQAEENARIAEQAAALIRRGDYAGLGVVLGDKVTLGGGASQDFVNELEDNLADLRAELRGLDTYNDQLQDDIETLEDTRSSQEHEISHLNAKLAEYRFYKQKVDFLEREYDLAQQRIAEAPPAFDDADIDVDFTGLGPLSDAARRKMEQLMGACQRHTKMIQNLKSNATLNTDEVLSALKGSGTQQEAMKKMLKAYSASQAKVTKSVEQASNAKRALAMLQKRDALNKDLQANRDNRLKQMEQAVLMVSTIHKRDRTKYQDEIKQKDSEIAKLKAYIQKSAAIARKREESTMLASSGMGMKAPRRRPKMKKRRPARADAVTAN